IRERTLPGIAALIGYGEEEPDRARTKRFSDRPRRAGNVGISLIGLGNHALAQHLPNLKATDGVEIRGIASATARHAPVASQRAGATIVTTDIDAVLADPGTDGVIISSNQPEHYEHLVRTLAAGKSLLVEKPMVTTVDDFRDVLRRVDELDERPIIA